MRKMKVMVAGVLIAAMLAAVGCPPPPAVEVVPEEVVVPPRVIRAAWVQATPLGDGGWADRHYAGMRAAEAALYPALEVIFLDAIPPPDFPSLVDELIREKNKDIIISCTSAFIPGVIPAAERHPDTMFFQITSAEMPPLPNLGQGFAEILQAKYLSGLMAGALTETNIIGYVGAHPIALVTYAINAFAIGARTVNPDVVIDVRWTFAWFDPVAARAAAEALIIAGADVLAFTENSPTVVKVAKERGLPVFGHYGPQWEFAPDNVVSGHILEWSWMYTLLMMKVYHGVITSENIGEIMWWWGLKEGAGVLGAKKDMPINPVFADRLRAVIVDDPVVGEINVYDLVHLRMAQMKEERVLFDPFDGPVYDRKGIQQIAPGERANRAKVWGLLWAHEAVIGPWPPEK